MKKTIRLGLFLFVLFIALHSASAQFRLENMPHSVVPSEVYHVKLVVEEPILQKYTESVDISCRGCGLIFDPALKNRYGNINYSGQKQIDFYLSGGMNPYSDELYEESLLVLNFVLDYDAIISDYPEYEYSDFKIDPMKHAASITKKFYIIKPELFFDEPKLWADSEGEFERDEIGKLKYINKLDSTESDGLERLTRYSAWMGRMACFEETPDENYPFCSVRLTSDLIEQGYHGLDPENTRVDVVSYGNAKGYALISAKVSDIYTEYDLARDEKYNMASVSVTQTFEALDPSTKENLYGSMSREGVVREGNQDKFVQDSLDEFQQMIESFKVVPRTTAPKTYDIEYNYNLKIGEKKQVKSDDGCSSDSDCEKGYRCTACEKCIKEKKVVDPSEVELEFKTKHQFSSKSMPNTIHNIIRIKSEVKPVFRTDKGRVDYCNIAMPGIDGYELVANMENDNSYAGFTFGRVLDPREKETKCPFDFTEKIECNFLIAPKDRKKIVGALGDVSEKLSLTIQKDGNEITKHEDSITLKPIEMDIKFKTSSQEMQQNSQKLLRYHTENKKAKHIFYKIRLIGPGEMEIDGIELKKQYTNMPPGKKGKIMYYSPRLGNFDIGQELQSLSMVDLQTEAAKAIAEDTLLAYAGEYAVELEKSIAAGDMTKAEKAGVSALRKYYKRNPGTYDAKKTLEYVRALNAAKQDAKKVDFLSKSFRLSKGVYDLSKMPKNQVTLTDDMKEVAGKKTANQRKTWTESFAETGVLGIDVLQTGVSILTFVPNKIPVVKEVSAAGQSAFSAMTNVWKANFKYIAKNEKIKRAEEKFLPVMILITAEDESGWQVSKGYIIKVAYHEI